MTPQVRLNAERSSAPRFVANEGLLSRVRVMMDLQTRRPRETLSAPRTFVLCLSRRDCTRGTRGCANPAESATMLRGDDTIGHARQTLSSHHLRLERIALRLGSFRGHRSTWKDPAGATRSGCIVACTTSSSWVERIKHAWAWRWSAPVEWSAQPRRRHTRRAMLHYHLGIVWLLHRHGMRFWPVRSDRSGVLVGFHRKRGALLHRSTVLVRIGTTASSCIARISSRLAHAQEFRSSLEPLFPRWIICVRQRSDGSIRMSQGSRPWTVWHLIRRTRQIRVCSRRAHRSVAR